jgi:hypothetical protein
LGFPWFRTHPKPVLLDPLPPASEEQHRVAWHGTAVYPSSGRLYFKDSYDHFATKSRPANARGGSRTALPKRNQ